MGSVVGAVEEGDHLSAVAGGGGAEVGGIHTVGDAVLHSPEDGVIEEIGGFHIGEGIACGGGLGIFCGTVQEGDHLGALALAVGVEAVLGCTGGDSVCQSPLYGIIVEGTGGGIHHVVEMQIGCTAENVIDRAITKKLIPLILGTAIINIRNGRPVKATVIEDFQRFRKYDIRESLTGRESTLIDVNNSFGNGNLC